MGFGLLAEDQPQEGFEKSLSAIFGVVNELEEAKVERKTLPALWSSHPTRPPGLATPPPLFFLASSFCEPIAPYTAAHDPTP